MRTRRAVSIDVNPPQPDPTLLWYSRAIGVMRQRPFTDPTSWRFQGAIHDYDTSTDPYLDPADPPPSGAIQQKYWKKCQHSSWFFLPWHRMYLHHFEQMVADAVVAAGGPANWALPYWDYNASPAARFLPWAFRQPTWPDGETNHLYVDQRDPDINSGATSLSSADIDTSTAMSKQVFGSAPTAADVQFGGPRVKNHNGGALGLPFGALESSPHNHVHVAVGGSNGFMYDPRTAGLDPIFWLHHCNIDRLWEVWLRLPGRVNPTSPAWRKTTRFSFFDAAKTPVQMRVSDVLDTTSLDYHYDGMPSTPVPFATVETALSERARRPTMIGATPVSVPLADRLSRIAVSTPEAPSRQERVLLHLESITSARDAGSYDVYINLPDGSSPADHPELHAGRITLFGGTDVRGDSHARRGFSFVLDITAIYEHLSAAGQWSREEVHVDLEQVYPWSGPATVGRVSVNVLE